MLPGHTSSQKVIFCAKQYWKNGVQIMLWTCRITQNAYIIAEPIKYVESYLHGITNLVIIIFLKPNL